MRFAALVLMVSSSDMAQKEVLVEITALFLFHTYQRARSLPIQFVFQGKTVDSFCLTEESR